MIPLKTFQLVSLLKHRLDKAIPECHEDITVVVGEGRRLLVHENSGKVEVGEGESVFSTAVIEVWTACVVEVGDGVVLDFSGHVSAVKDREKSWVHSQAGFFAYFAHDSLEWCFVKIYFTARHAPFVGVRAPRNGHRITVISQDEGANRARFRRGGLTRDRCHRRRVGSMGRADVDDSELAHP